MKTISDLNPTPSQLSRYEHDLKDGTRSWFKGAISLSKKPDGVILIEQLDRTYKLGTRGGVQLDLKRSLDVEKLDNRTIQKICTEIQTAKNWKLSFARVTIKGIEYTIPVTEHAKFQSMFKIVIL